MIIRSLLDTDLYKFTMQMERAEEVRSNLHRTPENAPAIDRICRNADGLPLAIEITAGLLSVLTLEEIAALLPSTLAHVPDGDPTRPERQHTLTALLEWSDRLLSPSERALFHALSVFQGGWTLDAAVAVTQQEPASGPGDGGASSSDLPGVAIPEQSDLAWRAMHLLSRLIARSLVVAEDQAGIIQYRFLETVRSYAGEKLAGTREEPLLRRRHQRYFEKLAIEAAGQLTGAAQSDWLERLDSEIANLRLALALDIDAPARDAALRIAGALGRFWQIRGHFSEGRDQLARTLRQAQPVIPSAAAGEAHNWASVLAVHQSDYAAARLHAEAGLATWKTLGDARGLGGSLGCLGMIAKGP